LLDFVPKIMDQLHELSGKPVLVQADPTLKTLSTIRIARGPAPVHVVLYNPASASFADYLIAYQCGFAIRIFQLPESDRFDLTSSYRGQRDSEKLVNEKAQQSDLPLNKAGRLGLRDQMLNGLLIQLRSVPIGLRIDHWIASTYPALKDQQAISIRRQLNDNLESLRPEIKRFAPEQIHRANVSMNAAFAAFWSRLWGEAMLNAPYKATGHFGTGEELLADLDRLPQEAGSDRALMETWAERLGIRSWLEFVPGPK